MPKIGPDLWESFTLDGHTYVIPINVVVEIDRLRVALREIAKQVKTVNLTGDGVALADFPGAYDDMIDVARAALQSQQ